MTSAEDGKNPNLTHSNLEKGQNAEANKPRSIEEVKNLFPGLPARKTAFLIAFALSGQVLKSCETVGIHWTTHYQWKRRDKKYLEAFQTAEQIAADFMEDEIHRRAFEGIDKPVTWRGEITDTYKEFSDLLAMFRLKKLRPEYRDNFIAGSMTGPVSISITYPSLPEKPVLEDNRPAAIDGEVIVKDE